MCWCCVVYVVGELVSMEYCVVLCVLVMCMCVVGVCCRCVL